MTDNDDTANDARQAFDDHDAFDRDGTAYALSTTPFDAHVEVTDEPARYRVTVRVPGLDATTEEPVEDVLCEGWFDTLSLRLEDAPGVTRANIDVPEPTVERLGEAVRVAFEFAHDDPPRAAAAAKALIEYVEGTYVEGIVPGYSYRPPVSDLLSRARQQSEGDGESGAMPL